MKKPLTRTVAGRRVTVEIEVNRDEETGLEVSTDAALERAELEVAADLADSGPIVGEAFAFVRQALGLQGKEAARLLGVRPETITRWEQGHHAVDRSAFIALGELVFERLGRARALRARMERLAG